MPGLPKKKLQVVPVERPYAALAASLDGDRVRDKQLVRDFCAKHSVSLNTTLNRLKHFHRRTRSKLTLADFDGPRR
jgi:hypothetical protein